MTFISVLTLSMGIGMAAPQIASADASNCIMITHYWSSGLAKGAHSYCEGINGGTNYPLNEQRIRILCRKNGDPTVVSYKYGYWVAAQSVSAAFCSSNYTMTEKVVLKR